MKKIIQISLIFSLVFGFIQPVAPAQAALLDIFSARQAIQAGQTGQPIQAGETEILVKLKDSSQSRLDQVLSRHQLSNQLPSLTSHLQGIRALRLLGSSAHLSAKLAALNADPDVEFAEPNHTAYAYSLPNDQYFGFQWNLGPQGLDMPQVWEQATGLGAVVAVIDTGVAYENYRGFAQAPDLANTGFVTGRNFVKNSSHANDDNGHGTHVTGTIAQSTHNSTGTAGMAYNAQIMPIKALDSAGAGKYSDIADAIIWAADHGANIINLSLGGPYPSETMRLAVSYAKSRGVLIVAASGNNGANSVGYPAAYDDYVLAVGASRYDKSVTAYSNRGSSLDVVAPGGDTKVDQDGNGYGDGILQQTFTSGPKNLGYYFFQGTSMAAPHVAGLAALLVEKGITSPDELQSIIQSSADDIYSQGWDAVSGFGLINPLRALEMALGNDDNDNNHSQQEEILNPADAKALAGEQVQDSEEEPEPEPQPEDPKQEDPAPKPNKKPTAKFNSQAKALIGDAIVFDATESSDQDGSITDFSWDFGDGSKAQGLKPSHIYATLGIYTVKLTVTDDNQDTASFSAEIEITEPAKKEISVSSLEVSARGSFLRISAQAKVKITDQQGNPVRNAQVLGQWSGLSSRQQTLNTNSRGEASFYSDTIWRRSGEFIFSVKSVSHEDYVYNSENNAKSEESVQISTSRSFSITSQITSQMRGLMN